MEKKKIIFILELLAVVLAVGAAVFCIIRVMNKTPAADNNGVTQPPPSLISSGEIEGIDTYMRPAYYIAHRGLSGQAPENSIASIVEAGKADYYGCEFDIRLTSDGKWVLMHDEDSDRTTNGKGKVAELTYEQLSAYRIDTGNNVSLYSDSQKVIPTLDDALLLCNEYAMMPFIEVKSSAPEGISELLNMLERRYLTETVMIISFDMDILKAIREENADISLMLLCDKVTDKTIAECVEAGDIGIDFNAKNIKDSQIEAISDAGLALDA